MECYSCYPIADFRLIIDDRKDFSQGLNPKAVSFCYQDNLRKYVDGIALKIPASIIADDPKETLERVMALRSEIIAKGKWADKDSGLKDRKFGCYHCDAWHLKSDWKFSPFISQVDLRLSDSSYQNGSYVKILDTLQLIKKQKLIAPKGMAVWNVSLERISDGSYRDQIMNLVTGEKVCFLIEGISFDISIARELQYNPRASICALMDAGTADTWRKIRGINNFNEFLEILERYQRFNYGQGQFTAEYKIWSGVNDSDDDFLSFANIMKLLGINKVTFSQNVNSTENIVDSTARFMAICGFHKIVSMPDDSYNWKEQVEIADLAQKILGEVLKI